VEPDRELIYVGDPMCSWCWGIAPQLDALAERRRDLPFRIVVGGLRPGPNAEPMSDRMAAGLAHHWHDVENRSGQPFDHGLLARRDWTYDTEPACRAVVSMREVDETLVWPLFKRLQRAFYVEGIVLADPSVYPDLVRDVGADAAGFMPVFESPEAVKATWRDFSTARSWGISGFPTVVARSGRTGHLIAAGYSSADDMERALTESLGSTG
jgi:putative protein-disulfide isomerase